MKTELSAVSNQQSVKERPILFSTDMVKAILEGRKTMTRRIIKPQPEDPGCVGSSPIWGYGVPNFDNNNFYVNCATNFVGIRNDVWIKCPYGKKGDILWVKENHAFYINYESQVYIAGEGEVNFRIYDTKKLSVSTQLRLKRAKKKVNEWLNKPSIFLFKEFARIWLQITDIRVERLHEISMEDAKNEGVEKIKVTGVQDWAITYRNYIDHLDYYQRSDYSFRSLWVSINGKDSWNQNPWVWVVSFKVLSTTGKPDLIPQT